jgi:hypothetical protein
MVKYFISLLFLLASISEITSAQTVPPIQTDRPSQSESPYTVPKYYIQLENGFLKETRSSNSSIIYYPSTLWKYGINERFEIRMITELVSDKVDDNTTSGLKPITIGMKVNLFESKGILPMTSFIGYLATSDIGSKDFATTYYAPTFKFAMLNTLSDKITLGYNLGAKWDGESPEPIFLYTLNTGVSITAKLGGYVELYGFLPQKSKSDHRFDGGLSYLVTNNLLLDLSGGLGLTENAPEHYFCLGLSFRFNTAKK